MRKLIEHFDRSYIINLSDRTDRRFQAEREFRLFGIDIPNDRVRFYTAVRPTDKGGFVNIGTRGNFTSHRNVLELAYRDRLRNVLVFEDDASFRKIGDEFQETLLGAVSAADWDVIYFAYLSPSDRTLSGPLMPWAHDVIGAHFYAVNGRFIGTMLQYMNECEGRPRDHPAGGPMTADGAYKHLRYVMPNVKAFLSVPSLAYQRSSRTDIAPTGMLDNVAWLRVVLRGLRAIKHRVRMALDKP